jgi:transcriptional regulator with XRE-family HTH domain
MDVISFKIGQNIREIREKLNITQEKFAEVIGVSRASIVNMENGRQSISLVHLYNIAIFLRVEVSELLPSKQWFSENKDKKVKKIAILV